MKYLVTGMPGNIPIPPGQAGVLFKAAEAWIEERIKDGRIECHYVYLDRGGFTISNANSHEELMAELVTYPFYPFFIWEVKALCDWKEGYHRISELFEKMAVP